MTGDSNESVEDWNDVNNEAKFFVREERINEDEEDDRCRKLPRSRVHVRCVHSEWQTE